MVNPVNPCPPNWDISAVVALVGLAILIACLLGGCGDTDATPRAEGGGSLHGKRIAILVDKGFEQPELLQPRQALIDAGAATVLIAPESGSVRAWNTSDWGVTVTVDLNLAQAKAADFDALLLPGGVMSPDRLRINPQAVALVREFVAAGKPIAAICHGPWTLIEAGGVKGKQMTSWPSLRSDLSNAGASWSDLPVVRDRNLVTSRKPDDIPQFNRAMIELFSTASLAGGKH